MTLIKSVLLGSAATLMVVASAQAADLPTKKGAPAAEYVKVCKVGDIAGFLVPGTDTCLKLSGFVTARYAAGPTHDVYAISGGAATKVGSSRQYDAYGTWTRGRITADAASNTAYGPLIAHIDMEDAFGGGYIEGYTSPGTPHAASSNNGFQIDKAWITWAGLTAGKVESFFDYYAISGSAGSDSDLFAADANSVALAYTATFGGGFSATIAIETPNNAAGTAYSSATPAANSQFRLYSGSLDGDRMPDLVASLDVKQGWGDAHLAGILHEIHQTYAAAPSSVDTWGWGINGGVTFNLPSLGAGADFKATATYTEGDYAQSGAGSPWWYNLSGVVNDGATGDVYYNSVSKSWVKPTIFTAAGGFDIPVGPTFKVSPYASYADVTISTPAGSYLSKEWDAFIVGTTFAWTPVHNLSFGLDLLYEDGHQDKPSGIAAANWKSNFDGFIGELKIERDF